MSKTIALDIGGVCVHLYFDDFLRSWGLSAMPELLRLQFCEFECGRMGPDEIYASCCRELPVVAAAGADEFWRRFRTIIGEDIPGMPALARRWLAAGYRIVLFSNTSTVHADEVWRKFSIGDCISAAVYSYDVGAMKPDAAIYRSFEQQHGRPVYYFDDSAENIAAGRQLGWNSCLFTNVQEWMDRTEW